MKTPPSRRSSSHPATTGAVIAPSWNAPADTALNRPRSRSVARSLTMAGTVGCSIVSPSPKRTWKATTPTAASSVPATIPVAPSSAQAAAHRTTSPRKTRVRRCPSMTRSTRNCNPTMTAVFAAKASPMVRVDTSLT